MENTICLAKLLGVVETMIKYRGRKDYSSIGLAEEGRIILVLV